MLKGIGNNRIRVNHIGDFKGINVDVPNQVNSNILSLVIKYDNVNDAFAVEIGEDVLEFIRDDDLYKCFKVNAIFQDSLSKNQLNKINVKRSLQQTR